MRIELGDGAYLDCYIAPTHHELTMPPRPAVVVFPGGGYAYCSAREAFPVANQFIAAGCNTFTLNYRVMENAVDNHPLLDAARAVDHVRKHAEEYGINPEKIAVIGFSAGGHLATWLASAYNTPELKNFDCRPNAVITGYALINSHTGCFKRLEGIPQEQEANAEIFEKYHTDKMVHDGTTPMFLWHTCTDSLVTVRDTLSMGEALSYHNIPFEMHIFPYGVHGLSVCTEETTPSYAPQYNDPYIRRWVPMAIDWLNKLFER